MDHCSACAQTSEVAAVGVSYCTACGRIETASVAYQAFAIAPVAVAMFVAVAVGFLMRRRFRRPVQA